MSFRPYWIVLLATSAVAQSRADLRDAVEDLLDPLVRGEPRFELNIEAHSRRQIDLTAARVEGATRKDATVRVTLRRVGPESFELIGNSPWARFHLHRTKAATVLHLPAHGVTFLGKGEIPTERLAPAGLGRRMLGRKQGLLQLGKDAILALIAGAKPGAKSRAFAIDTETEIRLLPGAPERLVVRARSEEGEIVAGLARIELWRGPDPKTLSQAPPRGLRAGSKPQTIPRQELERMAFRAVRRALQTYVPQLRPDDLRADRKTEHGDLRHVDGHRLLLLHGTPEQMGHAQGKLLAPLVRRTVDSTLYLVGMIETVRTGKWFPDVLRGAWRRLSPHVPARHRQELDALADAVPALTREELQLASVFPEYFHCSGFALFGRATQGGKLYHGRVLDYMTMIGLQHAAVTTVVAPDRGYAFVNVGYAGFTGSVTGMNERQVSLGEMGGRGRGLWDGVPMATLMRRGLEECNTLDDVQALWRKSPRTCEYYYVFADGKHRRAVGVAATPDKLQFLGPGQDHEMLGKGIPDAVVLSAGSRLQRLRKRVKDQFGKIDEAAAIRLMDRPVAMSSNLHNALMVPEDGVIHIAHASQDEPAAKQRYVRYDFRALLQELPKERKLIVRDTLRAEPDRRAAAEAILQEIRYEPSRFPVALRPRRPEDKRHGGNWHSLVTFPSPKGTQGKNASDRVVLEWYHANPRRVKGVAKAVLVLHILDGRMRVARGVAQVLANKGLHAFVMHMPGYGQRRLTGQRRDPLPVDFLRRAQQSVADARRARDAIAALPGVDPASVSIQGTSLGGFIAALTAGVDDGFDRAFFMLAGGDLADMFENGKRDTAMVRAGLKQLGMSDADIRKMLNRIDPKHLAHRLRAKRTWLYSAKADTVVPPRNARALSAAAALGEGHHLWYAGNHYTCAVHLPTILQHMVAQLR